MSDEIGDMGDTGADSQREPGAIAPQGATEGESGEGVFDTGRNWTPDATKALVRAWRVVSLEGRGPDEKTTHVHQRVLNEYLKAVPTSTRKLKAIEDKMGTLGTAFRFIADFNAHRVPGSTGRGAWATLDPGEKKELRKSNGVRVPDLDNDIFDLMNSFMGDKPDIRPLPTSNNPNVRVTPNGGTQLTATPPMDEQDTRKRTRAAEFDRMIAKRQKEFVEALKEVRMEEQDRRDKRHAEMMAVLRAFAGLPNNAESQEES